MDGCRSKPKVWIVVSTGFLWFGVWIILDSGFSMDQNLLGTYGWKPNILRFLWSWVFTGAPEVKDTWPKCQGSKKWKTCFCLISPDNRNEKKKLAECKRIAKQKTSQARVSVFLKFVI